jgi:predicted flap endonuclease-1-like 5' DNA nuclease
MPIVDPPRFRVAPHEPEAPVVAVAAPEVPSGDDLTAIHGIGPVYAMRLHDRGITTFAELAAADGAQVADAIDVPRSRLDDWIEEAGSRS